MPGTPSFLSAREMAELGYAGPLRQLAANSRDPPKKATVNPARSITSKDIQLIGRKQNFNTLV
jgi:hypothetical protein